MHEITQPSMLTASTLKGNEVMTARAESLGIIDDVMVELASGRVTHAIVVQADGTEERLRAFPWTGLQFDSVNHRFVVTLPDEEVEKTPSFARDSWPDLTTPSWG